MPEWLGFFIAAGLMAWAFRMERLVTRLVSAQEALTDQLDHSVEDSLAGKVKKNTSLLLFHDDVLENLDGFDTALERIKQRQDQRPKRG